MGFGWVGPGFKLCIIKRAQVKGPACPGIPVVTACDMGLASQNTQHTAVVFGP